MHCSNTRISGRVNLFLKKNHKEVSQKEKEFTNRYIGFLKVCREPSMDASPCVQLEMGREGRIQIQRQSQVVTRVTKCLLINKLFNNISPIHTAATNHALNTWCLAGSDDYLYILLVAFMHLHKSASLTSQR